MPIRISYFFPFSHKALFNSVTMKIHSSRFLLLYSFLLAMLIMGVEVHGSGGHRKLFVFGDSYVDTGNLGKIVDITRSWYEPYGMTFPNHPTGRFSDGRVLTDYVASVLRIKSPIPYKSRQLAGHNVKYGMNFAVAGSGVFGNFNFQRTLSEQIDTFQSQIKEGVFSQQNVKSSIALVAISGNDYAQFLATGNEMKDMGTFIVNVTDQITLELERLHELGVGKVVATNLHPLGCTPQITRPDDYQKCNLTASLLVELHNQLLLKGVHKLKKRSDTPFAYHILDLNTAFMSVIGQEKGVRKFKNVLKPCCEGKGIFECGVELLGVKQYSLCRDPEEHYYWDSVHPTQAGWAAVFQLIRPWLTRNLS